MQYFIIPGFHNSGPEHWQTYWEKSLPGARRLEQRDWEHPDFKEWSASLGTAAEKFTAPTILIAHSLGVSLTVHYLTEHQDLKNIAGALLVAPADVDSPECTPDALRSFAPMPLAALPVPALVAASENDPFVTLPRAMFFAAHWKASCFNVGALGHINADSRLGDWPVGLQMLKTLEMRIARLTH